MTDLLSIDLSQGRVIWGGVLLVAFPLLAILLGELTHWLWRRGSQFAAIARFIQHFIMPQLVLLLIASRVLELPPDNVLVKIIETLLWVFIAYAVVTSFSLLVFAESGGYLRIKAPKLLLDAMRVVIMALGIATILSYAWGLELSKMMAAFGVGSIVLGLALQDTFSPLFAGFTSVASCQPKEGAWLEMGDTDLAKSRFVNVTFPYSRHVERVSFDFSFNDAPYKVKKVLISTALNTPGILRNPSPQVALTSYDKFSVRHEARFWINEYADLPAIRAAFVSRVWYAAQRAGITFPSRAHEVFMLPPPESERVAATHQIISALQASALLVELKQCELEALAGSAVIKSFAKGEAIINQGLISDDCFLLRSGEVLEHYVDNTGREYKFNRMQPGDLFGVVGLVRGDTDEISVFANVDCDVIVLDSKTLHAVVMAHSELALVLEQRVDSRFRELGALVVFH